MFKFDKKVELPESVTGALEDIDKDQERTFTEAYGYITKTPKAKWFALMPTVLLFVIWFTLFDLYRFYSGTIGGPGPLSNLFNLIPLPQENLVFEYSLKFISMYFTLYCLGRAFSFLIERIKVDRHLSKNSIGKYFKRNNLFYSSLLTIPFLLLFLIFVFDEMAKDYIFLRDLIVYMFVFITIYTILYNRLVFKFSYYKKKQVLERYLQALESLIEEAREEEKSKE